MTESGRIRIGYDTNGQSVKILPGMAKEHGLIAGDEGSGKTQTIKTIARALSDLGVPVLCTDVKGDLGGIGLQGTAPGGKEKEHSGPGTKDHAATEDRKEDASSENPVVFWDIWGTAGIPLRAGVTAFGPDLLAGILGLNALQTQLLTIVFRIADDEGLILTDLKDLVLLLTHIRENRTAFESKYGKLGTASLSAIQRACVCLDAEGGDGFFGEPELSVKDLLLTAENGKGTISILDAGRQEENPEVFLGFILWILAEICTFLPERTENEKVPRLVVFLDEADLFYRGVTKSLSGKIMRMAGEAGKKGVGLVFSTKDPGDLPGELILHTGTWIIHDLRFCKEEGRKALRVAFAKRGVQGAFPLITDLCPGEALLLTPGEEKRKAAPRRVQICAPAGTDVVPGDVERTNRIRACALYARYAGAVDRDSAFEMLLRQKDREDAGIAKEKKTGSGEKKPAGQKNLLQEKDTQGSTKSAAQGRGKKYDDPGDSNGKHERTGKKGSNEEEERQKKASEMARSVGGSAAGTIGREIGKNMGARFGTFGKNLGGNVGASIGRGIFSVLFKK